MEYRVGRTTHRDIQRHGIQESLTGSNVSRQNALVTILIIGKGILHHLTGCCLKELHTVGMRGEDSAIAWQRETDSLRQ